MNLYTFIDPKLPILIAGPTACGKSFLATKLAARFDGMIVNGDALQVYCNWRILTARPSEADEQRHPHHLYGHIGPKQPYSVGHWLREIRQLLDHNPSRTIIIVGGTGLYFSSLTNGLVDIPEIPAAIRQQSTARLEQHGINGLRDDLAQYDAKTLARIDQNNPMRVQRAWEVWTAFGRGLADWQDDTPPPLLPLSDCNAIVLSSPVDWLNQRIEKRFSVMISDGCLAECQENLKDWDAGLPSARAIGATALISHLHGEIDLPTAIEKAEVATRRYAKRQRSWFRSKMQDWHWLDLSTGDSG